MKDLNELKFDDSVRYSAEHTWAKITGELMVVGISDYAQDQLGDIIFIELPQPGDAFSADEVFGVVESAKTASDLFTPLGGEIVEINVDLSDTPELVNTSPYEEGWMVKIKPADDSQWEKLMTAEDYKKNLT